jgi:hypothetical protein
VIFIVVVLSCVNFKLSAAHMSQKCPKTSSPHALWMLLVSLCNSMIVFILKKIPYSQKTTFLLLPVFLVPDYVAQIEENGSTEEVHRH